MKNLRGTYVHRGDLERRRRRIRATVLLAGLIAAGTAAAKNWEPVEAKAEPVRSGVAERAEVRKLQEQVEAARSELAMATAQLERWHHVFAYSKRYHIDAALAASIYDAALTEGIDPDLAFPLVRLESDFNPKATSPVGALGLTQLMLPTARYYQANLSKQDLYEPSTNLRIGFRYLRGLIREQHGNVQMALLVYNRGPAAVGISKELGLDPSNGYDRILLKGYRGRGVID